MLNLCFFSLQHVAQRQNNAAGIMLFKYLSKEYYYKYILNVKNEEYEFAIFTLCAEISTEESLKLFVPWNLVQNVIPKHMVQNVAIRRVTVDMTNSDR